MSNKRNDRKAIRKSEALARNGKSNARLKSCGHVHGEFVSCETPLLAMLRTISQGQS